MERSATLLAFAGVFSEPLEVPEQRLVQRWLAHGLDETAIKTRAVTNDMPNAKRILEHRNLKAADIRP